MLMPDQSDAEQMESLTADEAEQYDRQIRLWGLDAQKRLRTSSVLVVGGRGLGSELCKNIVLAGVKSITLLDSDTLKSTDLGSRFLGTTNGVNRAIQAVGQLQALNPNVKVVADTESIEDKNDTFFTQFSAVCLTCCSMSLLIHINTICHNHNIKFFCGDVWGFYGYFFSDLGEHEYSIELMREIKIGETSQHDEQKTSVIKHCSFPTLKEALAVNWTNKSQRYFKKTPPTWFIIQILQEFRDSNNGRDPDNDEDVDELMKARKLITDKLGINSDLISDNFYKYCRCELSPVCAIVGGVLGQEVIKALSGQDEPYCNCFLYDSVNSTGIVETLST